MKYLTAQEILVIHSEVIDKIGGAHGIRDIGLLESIARKPKSGFGNKEFHKSVFEKAAVYTESLVNYHIFTDGNKRTGAVVAARFLFVSGYELTASNKELENFILRIATEKLDMESISAWFKKHTKRASKR